MIRVRDRIIIAIQDFGGELLYRADGRHLTTDPACVEHRPVRPGSGLDRRSRGNSCGACLMHRAFGHFPLTARPNPEMPTDEQLNEWFSQPGMTKLEALRGIWRNGCDAGMVAK